MIYADANATYPVDADHYDEVAKILKEMDGNPSSIHASGRNAKVALEEARTRVASMIGCRPAELVFTSGATEANNMVLQGIVNREARPRAKEGKLPHIIITSVEHKAILDPAMMLAERGSCRLDLAPVKATGELDIERLLELITADTSLVCIMHANNEIGMVYPVASLAKLIKERAPKAHIHVDAVQMLGKADLSWYAESAITSVALSGHKIGAYKGIGALYLQSGCKLSMFMAGGGQERGRRPGTENMPGIISFGLCCAKIRGTEKTKAEAMLRVRNAFLTELGTVSSAVIHGHTQEMLPNTVHFHIEGVPGDDLLLNLDLAGIQAASGSACSSGAARPSHVVMALGYSEWIALNSVRISFSAKSVVDDVAPIMSVIRNVVERSHR
jgi:cysteine desulfurase